MNRLEKAEWLEMAREVLVEEGFQHTILQAIEPGQVFGLVRKEDGIWQMHVRGFDDGSLKGHIEIRNDYFQHWNGAFRRDAAAELKEILDAHQIPLTVERDITHSMISLPYPERLTPWKPMAIISGIVGLLAALGRREHKRERG